MISLLKYIARYMFKTNEVTLEENEEDYLKNELNTLEFNTYNDNDSCEEQISDTEDFNKNRNCFERNGCITFLDENYGLIDGSLYFDREYSTLSLNINSKVRYLASYNSDNDTYKVIKILYCLETDWDDYHCNHKTLEFEEKLFQVKQHVFVGKVAQRKGRLVEMNNNIVFDLDKVEGSFIPIEGDWLEIVCNVQWDENLKCGTQAKEIIEVLKFRALRKTLMKGNICDWNGNCGSINNTVFFHQNVLNGFIPNIGLQVITEAIESDQEQYCWRSISLILDDTIKSINALVDDLSLSTMEQEKSLVVTPNLNFGNVKFNDDQQKLLFEVRNNSDQDYTIKKWNLNCSRYDSQLVISPVLFKTHLLESGSTFTLTIKCRPKYLGYCKEQLTLTLNSFEIVRYVSCNIIESTNDVLNGLVVTKYEPSVKNIEKELRNNRKYIPGVKPVKSPAFVSVKLGSYQIPKKIWNTVLGDSNETINSTEFTVMINRIEQHLPFLSENLNLDNYARYWHCLLYMEEIQEIIQIRVYDVEKAFLHQADEYLYIEFKNLSERRPTLIIGDRSIVKVLWDRNTPCYEGYIHQIRGDKVLMKFNHQFHNMYNGYDVSLEFHFSRTSLRRCHQAIDYAFKHLGPEVLFPTTIKVKEPFYDSAVTDWFNKNLNVWQKAAVQNILLGCMRPMPYIIFGPPGTGKTVTVVEAALQIIKLCPNSRILLATPSNSAANLLTQYLVESGQLASGSIIRIIAHHLVESDNIPQDIKPYCATLDITRERTAKEKYFQNEEGLNLMCRTSFIGRHRVIIGTCSVLGTLAQMELPHGHFTHIIIDEAGQATEPEIMIPLTFVDKASGQIVLAGDPMQLGPVVSSKYTKSFGYDISYLCRMLDRFPYQRDFESFPDTFGYDKRLITILTYNYRSLPEILKLPSEMFYNSNLVPQIKSSDMWVSQILNTISDLIPNKNNDSARGGIVFIGIRGVNVRAEDSPSWFNPQEAGMVLLQTCKLYKRHIKAEQIGIITPYLAQIIYLRKLFDSTGMEQPKIGTVEEFQGQERNIIIISTVRSNEGLLNDDIKHSLGFVRNPKRLNVALTRAQIAVFIFGNPHLLCQDSSWIQIIKYSLLCKTYIGCDLPTLNIH